jgi:hypothetical protein
MRLRGYNKEDLQNSAYIVLNLGFNVDNKISGKVDLEYNNIFDQDLGNDDFGTYEAYADFTNLGPVDQLRVGKYNLFVGSGMTLMDRREGFTLESERNDMLFQIGYFDALHLLAQTNLPGDGRLGFYYIKEDTVNDRAPRHMGMYAAGKITEKISYEGEIVDYSHDGTSPAGTGEAPNRNDETMAFYFGARYMPKEDGMTFRLAYIDQQEDYRALAVDSDLRFRGGRYSVLEDVLQAIRDFTPSWVDPDEINGFRDIKIGVDFKLGKIGWDGRFDLDLLFDNTSNLDNSNDEFNLITLAFDRNLGADTNFQLRYQALLFDNENGTPVSSIPDLKTSDENSLMAQFMVNF